MTEANESTVDILNCTICLETLKKPKSLPCLHTFCESCLVSYITSGLEKHQENINCPLCRESVNRPSETCTPKEWVEDLPSNFLLAGLIESRKVERSEKLCMLCERASKQPIEKAAYFCAQCTDTLCQTCENFHRHIKLFSGHNVKPINEISNEDKLFPEPRNTCEQHKNDTLKLYCVDHKTPCCCICVSSHRKCENVKSLKDAAKGIADSKEIKDIRCGYENIEKSFESDIVENKTASEKIENDYETALQTIEIKYDFLANAVSQQKEKRKSELEKVYNEINDRKEGLLIGLENKQRMIGNEIRVLNACLQGASEMQVLIEMTKFWKPLKTHENENKDFKTITSEIGSGIKLENVDTDKIVSIIETSLKIVKETPMYNITRFSGALGSTNNQWRVKGETDAIICEFSHDIYLCGFFSYGCREVGKECNIQITVKRGDQTFLELKTELSKSPKDYRNSITELMLDKPVKLSSNSI